MSHKIALDEQITHQKFAVSLYAGKLRKWSGEDDPTGDEQAELETMEAILGTLLWMRAHKETIMRAVSKQASKETDRANEQMKQLEPCQ